MIIEKAREVLQEQIDRYGQEYDAEGIEALEMAIKALSSWAKYSDALWKKAYVRGCNDVLAMIRAEIELNAYPIVHGVNNHEKGMTLYGILQIIDKYKAESKTEQALAYADQDTLMPAT